MSQTISSSTELKVSVSNFKLTEFHIIKALFNFDSLAGLLADFFRKQVTNVNILPFEVLRNFRTDFTLLCTWHSDDETSAH